MALVSSITLPLAELPALPKGFLDVPHDFLLGDFNGLEFHLSKRPELNPASLTFSNRVISIVVGRL
jgi:hypothetical protein